MDGHLRRTGRAPRSRPLSLLFAALAVFVTTLTLLGSAPASAADLCVKPAPDRTAIHFVGCLRDVRSKPAKAVPGVTLNVTDEAGKVVATGQSDATGYFSIAIPGDTFDVLGKSFTLTLDTKTLPEGTKLTDDKKVAVTQKFNTDADAGVNYQIGDLPKGTGTATQALQLFVGGIVFALILAMASLGLSMIFGTTGLTNFAHGELITFGALAAFFIDRLPGTLHVGSHNFTVLTGVLFAVVAGGLFGLVQDTALWRPLRRRGTGLVAMMIVSIGLSIFLRSVYQYLVGGDTKLYSQYAQPKPYSIGPVDVTPTELSVIAACVVILVLVTLGLQRTQLGKATRAVADNPALAASSGINVDRVIRAVWVGGAALAALSGVFLGLTQGFDFQIGFKILLLVFAATTLGGLGTAWGAIVGALIIGIFIEMSTLIVPAELKFTGALIVLILVLLVRPQGLLGKAQRVG